MATKALFVEDEGGRRVRALGSTMVVKAAAAQTGGAYEVVVVECGPGGDGVPHRHPWQELYLVLEGEMTVTVTLTPVSVGTELRVVQEGIPDAIPAEACRLGWQESLAQLALLVEPTIPD